VRPLSFLLFLPLLGVIPIAQAEEEIILNSTQTPDDVGAFYLDDFDNSGEVSGLPRERIAVIGEDPQAIQVGDMGHPGIPGRIRKSFLLFRLPDLQGKSIKHALLTMHLRTINQDGPAPLPPLFLVHAKEWDVDLWDSDVPRRGLQLSDYADVENFSSRVEVCDANHQTPGSLSIDVTEMIKANYERGAEPVAAFRLEVGDQQSLDITDKLYNNYIFIGPWQSTRRAKGEALPENLRPSLSLIVE
jgi:hypothetical protein